MKTADSVQRTATRTDQPAFVRALGLWDASLLVIGCIIGVGIFRTSSSIASLLPSAPAILALWLIGGLLSLSGALCYAELAAMFPKSGGDYVYITAIYGRFLGFLFGWTKLFVERTGTIAVLGYVFAEYLSGVLGYGAGVVRWVATAAVLALTFINTLGIRHGTAVQNLMSLLKILALAAIVLVGLLLRAGEGSLLATAPAASSTPLWQSAGVALVFVLWTYGGWTEAAYVAEETRDPERNVPLAIVNGLLATTLLYLVVNAVYLWYVPIEEMPQTRLVASVMMSRALGPIGATVIGAMIACSAFGALNGYVLTGARILYALGQDHALFGALGRLDPRSRVPALALWINAAVAIALIFTKTFEQIMTYSTVVISVFFTMAVLGVIALRRREPDRARPYRAWGYPWTPLAYSLVMIGFMADVCWKQPSESLFGFAFLALGVPLYALSQRLSRG